MAAGVVDDLEAIEVEITQHVLSLAAMTAFGRLLQPPLEFAAVDEPRERIVRRLIGHLAGEAAQLRDIVQQQCRADDLLRRVADGRGRQLDGALAAVAAGKQQGAAAQVHRRPTGERLSHRIGQQAPVRLIDQPDQILEVLAKSLLRAAAGDSLRGRVHVTDVSLRVGGDDRFRKRVESQQADIRAALDRRRHGRRIGHLRRQTQGRNRLRGNDLHARHQQGGSALVIHRCGRDLEAAHLALYADHVDLIALRGGLSRQPAADVVADQLGVLRRHQVGELAAHQLDTIHPHEARELPVRVENDVAVDEHRLVNAIAELREQLGHARIGLGARRRPGEQMIDRRDQRGALVSFGLQLDPPVEPPTDRDLLQLLRQFPYASQSAALQDIEHEQDARDQREQEAEEPEDGHKKSSRPRRMSPAPAP